MKNSKISPLTVFMMTQALHSVKTVRPQDGGLPGPSSHEGHQDYQDYQDGRHAHITEEGEMLDSERHDDKGFLRLLDILDVRDDLEKVPTKDKSPSPKSRLHINWVLLNKDIESNWFSSGLQLKNIHPLAWEDVEKSLSLSSDFLHGLKDDVFICLEGEYPVVPDFLKSHLSGLLGNPSCEPSKIWLCPSNPSIWTNAPDMLRISNQLGFSWYIANTAFGHFEKSSTLWRPLFCDENSRQWLWPWCNIVFSHLVDILHGPKQPKTWRSHIKGKKENALWNKMEEQVLKEFYTAMGGERMLRFLMATVLLHIKNRNH